MINMENREIENKITEILYKNSSDDSSHLKIKFENINNVIKLLVDISDQQTKALTDEVEELKSRISKLLGGNELTSLNEIRKNKSDDKDDYSGYGFR